MKSGLERTAIRSGAALPVRVDSDSMTLASCDRASEHCEECSREESAEGLHSSSRPYVGWVYAPASPVKSICSVLFCPVPDEVADDTDGAITFLYLM